MYEIKDITLSEIDNAINLALKVFMEFEAPEYSQEGINSFTSYVKSEDFKEMFKEGNNIFLGCYDKEKLVGLIAFRSDSHISLLFVDKEYHRKGIATRLMEEAVIRIKNKGIKEITVNSSPYAVPFYHSVGFKDTNSEQLSDGIRYTPMKYIVK